MGKGRKNPRLHVLFGANYTRKDRICLNGELGEEKFEKIEAYIREYLEETRPAGTRKHTPSPAAHTTQVAFVLGRERRPIPGVESIEVTLAEMSDLPSKRLRKALQAAYDRAHDAVGVDRPTHESV